MTIFFLVLCLTITSLAIFFNYNNKDKKIPTPTLPKEEVGLSQEQKDFNALFLRVQKLEELSKQYDETDYKLRALIYLRSCKYNDAEWNYLGGDVDADFNLFVEQNEGEAKDVSSFRPKYNEITGKDELTEIYFTIPSTKEKVDFYHLFAVMNIAYLENQSSADMSGWGGDLIQLASSIKNYKNEYFKQNSVEITSEQLKEKITQEFNKSAEFGFGAADVSADFDAVNIAPNLKTSSIYSAITSYYKNITSTKRIQQFRDLTFTEEYYSSIELEFVIQKRLTSNILTNLLMARYDIKLDNVSDLEIFNTCIKVFAEYVFSA